MMHRTSSKRPEDMPAAGSKSGFPLAYDFLTKFDDKPGRSRNNNTGLMRHQIARTDWATMKYDTNWHAHSDIPRPHNASDYTGYPKLLFG
ncbi:unnamed protein product [Prorocentrum cordatum]|uniref:Phospholipase B-like n=1 Tax=Prorocentrum cordatum TaxID=2364126 RepID=A0ABN9VI71_9DINO|nr:unnamed protein product [Polarella glacialis]